MSAREKILGGLFLSAALASTACSSRYEALTAAPPTTVSKLDDGEKKITLTEGIALAFECFDYKSEVCTELRGDVADRNVARLLRANLDTLSAPLLDENGQNVGTQPRAVLVIVGGEPGRTTLRVWANGGNADTFDVEVLEARDR